MRMGENGAGDMALLSIWRAVTSSSMIGALGNFILRLFMCSMREATGPIRVIEFSGLIQ